MPHTKRVTYPHGNDHDGDGWQDIEWLKSDGSRMQAEHWNSDPVLTMFFPETDPSRSGLIAVAVMLNATATSKEFTLPGTLTSASWSVVFHSSEFMPAKTASASWKLSRRSITCAFYQTDTKSTPDP